MGLCLLGWAVGVQKVPELPGYLLSGYLHVTNTLLHIKPKPSFFLNSLGIDSCLSNFFPQRCGSIKFRISERQKDRPSPIAQSTFPIALKDGLEEARHGSHHPRSICHFYSRAWFQVLKWPLQFSTCRMTTVLGLYTLFPGMCPGAVVVLLVIYWL